VLPRSAAVVQIAGDAAREAAAEKKIQIPGARVRELDPTR
jgi:hypothetical protein